MLKWLFSRQTGPRTPPAPGKDAPDHIRLGRDGEKVAAALLRRAGFELLDRNWRQGRLELDMVCRESGVLVFVEVKTRRSDERSGRDPGQTACPHARGAGLAGGARRLASTLPL